MRSCLKSPAASKHLRAQSTMAHYSDVEAANGQEPFEMSLTRLTIMEAKAELDAMSKHRLQQDASVPD